MSPFWQCDIKTDHHYVPVLKLCFFRYRHIKQAQMLTSSSNQRTIEEIIFSTQKITTQYNEIFLLQNQWQVFWNKFTKQQTFRKKKLEAMWTNFHTTMIIAFVMRPTFQSFMAPKIHDKRLMQGKWPWRTPTPTPTPACDAINQYYAINIILHFDIYLGSSLALYCFA